MSLICKKCFIGQQAEDYIRFIEKNKNAVAQKYRTSEDEMKNRIALCEQCEHLVGATCMACGCYVELRALKKSVHCPMKKW